MNYPEIITTSGFTVRDRFAALAMHATLICRGQHSHIGNTPSEALQKSLECKKEMAVRSYRMADAMMAERSEVPPVAPKSSLVHTSANEPDTTECSDRFLLEVNFAEDPSRWHPVGYYKSEDDAKSGAAKQKDAAPSYLNTSGSNYRIVRITGTVVLH